MSLEVTHFARGYQSKVIEENCPCEKAACGSVVSTGVDESCPEHAFLAGKTLRDIHYASSCPAV